MSVSEYKLLKASLYQGSKIEAGVRHLECDCACSVTMELKWKRSGNAMEVKWPETATVETVFMNLHEEMYKTIQENSVYCCRLYTLS